MSRAITVLVLGAIGGLGGGCAELAPPQRRVKVGPAAARPVKRVVVIPATCGSLQLVAVPQPEGPATWAPAPCPEAALAGVDQVVRSSLDFAGLAVIDSERVNAVTASRHEVVRGGQGQEHERTIDTVGVTFEDVTPPEQAAILRELGADAVVNTRIWFGAGIGASDLTRLTVQVRMVAAVDRALVWARRCELEIALTGAPAAMTRAARCAIEATP